MSRSVSIGFEEECLNIALSKIHPVRIIGPAVKKSTKYRQIATSVREVGLVEPLIVHKASDRKGGFLLLDGHLRLEALRDLDAKEATCLIAKDDEAFTYNKRVNRLSSVQEHYMILKAIKNGVPEARIAKALGVDVARIREKKRLLAGICPEAVEILKNRRFPENTIRIMRRVKPVRQVEMAELMVAANNFSVSYARAVLIATPNDQLVEPEKHKSVAGLSEDERRNMEQEMENLHRNMKAVEENLGEDILCLVVANGYVLRLLENDQVAEYLQEEHKDLYGQLLHLTESIAADTGTASQTVA